MQIDEALAELVKSNAEALHQFLETMCPLEIKNGETFQNTLPESTDKKYESVGVIGISGVCQGSVSVHVEKNLGIAIAKTLLGLEEEPEEAEVYDCIGELTNIVVGGAKTIAASSGLEFDISCPTVIRGNPWAVVEPMRGSQFSASNYTVAGHALLILPSIIKMN